MCIGWLYSWGPHEWTHITLYKCLCLGHRQSDDSFSRQQQLPGLVSMGSGQRPRYSSRYWEGPVKRAPALGNFFKFDVSIDPLATMESNAAHEDLESKANHKNKGEEDYRQLARCWGLLPGAGLDPPPASSSLRVYFIDSSKPISESLEVLNYFNWLILELNRVISN